MKEETRERNEREKRIAKQHKYCAGAWMRQHPLAHPSMRMTFEYPDLDKVKHLIFLQDTTPFEKYPEIVDNI
jgi:hypothetical protein